MCANVVVSFLGSRVTKQYNDPQNGVPLRDVLKWNTLIMNHNQSSTNKCENTREHGPTTTFSLRKPLKKRVDPPRDANKIPINSRVGYATLSKKVTNSPLKEIPNQYVQEGPYSSYNSLKEVD
jgi:hypothetical protein